MQTNGSRIGPAISRRALLKSGAGLAAAAMVNPGAGQAQAPKRGGTLRVSNGGDPPISMFISRRPISPGSSARRAIRHC